MRRTIPIKLSAAELHNYCRKNHTRKLALFGSILRDDFGEDSDVEVLVEFEPGHVPGLGFIRIVRRRRALAIAEKALRRRHPDTKTVRTNLQRLLDDME